jgi:hypothetical protein
VDHVSNVPAAGMKEVDIHSEACKFTGRTLRLDLGPSAPEVAV